MIPRNISVLLLLLSFSPSASAVQISGTAVNPAIENDGSPVPGGQLVLFVVDRDDNGFSGISTSDILSEGSILNGDDYILSTGSTTSFGPTSGFTSFSSFSFSLGDNDIQGNDEFAVYFFDNTAENATSAVTGFYALATDPTWLIPTNNSAVFNFSGTADADSFQQLSNIQATNAIVPEPSTFAALAGFCALGWVMLRRRRG